MKKRKITKFILPAILIIIVILMSSFVIQRIQWRNMDTAERQKYI